MCIRDSYLTASTEEEKVTVTAELEQEIDERVQALGQPDLRTWVGSENYEMRVAGDGSWIDKRILAILRGEVDR